jgi:L-alanine-DL-glutamate epimerase-like enolase superfamily enzyme
MPLIALEEIESNMPNLAVSGVRTTIVDLPIRRPHRFAHHSIDTQSYLIVEVDPDAGVVGVGEGVSPGVRGGAARASRARSRSSTSTSRRR